jgi:hypothetical protein
VSRISHRMESDGVFCVTLHIPNPYPSEGLGFDHEVLGYSLLVRALSLDCYVICTSADAATRHPGSPLFTTLGEATAAAEALLRADDAARRLGATRGRTGWNPTDWDGPGEDDGT